MREARGRSWQATREVDWWDRTRAESTCITIKTKKNRIQTLPITAATEMATMTRLFLVVAPCVALLAWSCRAMQLHVQVDDVAFSVYTLGVLHGLIACGLIKLVFSKKTDAASEPVALAEAPPVEAPPAEAPPAEAAPSPPTFATPRSLLREAVAGDKATAAPLADPQAIVRLPSQTLTGVTSFRIPATQFRRVAHARLDNLLSFPQLRELCSNEPLAAPPVLECTVEQYEAMRKQRSARTKTTPTPRSAPRRSVRTPKRLLE